MAQDIAKKVTLSKIGIDKDWIQQALREQKDDAAMEVAAFVGMISNVKSKSTDIGEYILFEGDFKGVNMITGENIESSALILPPVAETPLMNMFRRATKVDEEGNVLSQGLVEFAITITVKRDKAAVGYSYGVRNHVPSGKTSPMLRLLRMIPLTPAAMSKLPALEAPEDGDVEVAKLEAPGKATGGKKK